VLAVIQGLAADSQANIWAVGYCNGVVVDAFPSGGYDAFLLKYTENSVVFSRAYGGEQNDIGYGVALNGEDIPFISGDTENSLENFVNLGDYDVFVTSKITAGN